MPLPSFAPFPYFPESASLWGALVLILVCTVALYWVIYTIIAVYHWTRYAHAPFTTLLVTALHLCVSFLIVGGTLLSLV